MTKGMTAVENTVRMSVSKAVNRARSGRLALALLALIGVGSAAAQTPAGVYPVSDYGAVCDGVTDDTAAIQAAVDVAATAGGGIVTLAGTCVVAPTVRPGGMGAPATPAALYLTADDGLDRSRIVIRGEGPGASVVTLAAGSYSDDLSLILIEAVSAIDLRALTVAGNRAGVTLSGTQNRLLSITSAQQIAIDGVALQEFAGDAVVVDGEGVAGGVRQLSFRQSRIAGVDGRGLVLRDGVEQVSLRDNAFADLGGCALALEAGTLPVRHTLVKGNSFAGTGATCSVSLDGTDDVRFANNTIVGGVVSVTGGASLVLLDNSVEASGAGAPAIALDQATDVTVAGNTIERIGAGAVEVAGGSGITVESNRIGTDGTAIQLRDASRVLVRANVLHSLGGVPAGDGIRVLAQTAEVALAQITHNQAIDFATGVLLDPELFDIEQVLVSNNLVRSSVADARGVWVEDRSANSTQATNCEDARNLLHPDLVNQTCSDIFGPVLAVTSPSAIVFNDTAPTIVVTYTDADSGVDTATLIVSLDGADITATCTVDASMASCPSPVLGAGGHTVNVQLSDLAGNASSLDHPFEVILDTDPPTLAITEPSSSPVNTATPPIAVTYADAVAGIDQASVAIVVDGADITSSCVVDAAGATCVSPSLTEGSHTVDASASDLAGNSAVASFAFEVVLGGDVTPPTLEIVTPSTPVVLNDLTPLITIVYSDAESGVDVDSLRLRSGSAEIGATCSIEANQATCDPPPLGAGSRVLEAEVHDLAGNVAIATLAFEIVLDTEPPVLNIIQPEQSPVIDDETPEVVVTYFDADAGLDLATLVVSVDGVDFSAGCTIGLASATCEPPTLAEGNHQIHAEMTDEVGLTTTADRDFDLDLDDIAPTITIAEPVGSVVLQPEPPIFVEITLADDDTGVDFSSFLFRVDGEDETNGCDIGATSASCFPIVAAGLHDLVVEIADLAGNLASDSRTVDVTFDADAPSLTIDMPVAGDVVDTPTVLIALTYDDVGSGIDLGALRVVLNSTDITMDCSSGPANASCTAGPLIDGAHTLTVEIVDLAGNATSTSISFGVDALDQTPPTLTIDAPMAGTVAGTGSPIVELSYADPSGIDTASLLLLSDVLDVTASCQTTAAQATCSIPPLAAGPHSVFAQIRDVEGNLATASVVFDLELQLPIAIIDPASGFLTRDAEITVSGTVADGTDTVTINNVEALVSGGTFVAEGVPLHEGGNTVTAVARSAAGGVGVATVAVVRDTQAPLLVLVSPPDGFVTSEPQIVIAGEVSDPSSSSSAVAPPLVTVNGVVTTVEQRAFAVEDFLLQPGENIIRAEASDTAGNVGVSEIYVTFLPDAEQKIVEMLGNAQRALAGEAVAQPLIVQVVDYLDRPLPGRGVVFTVSRGDGLLASPPIEARTVEVQTDDLGFARASFTLGTRSGSGNHEVTVSSPGIPGQVVFCATADPGPPQRIVRILGASQLGAQVAVAGAETPDPLMVQVFDPFGNPAAGVEVTFEAVTGGGDFGGQPTSTAFTDAEGKAAMPFRLGPAPGTNNNVVEALFEDLAESPAIFTISGLVPGPESDTAVGGVVLDNQDDPVPGVTISIEDTTLGAVTDAQGRFSIADAPVGTIHLEVDGSTTSLPGDWPHLEFKLTTISGRDNTLGKAIRLLPIDTAAGSMVGGDEDVTLYLADVPGAELTVFAGSTIFPDGATEGLLSITQVHGDKVPMEAPMGSNFMLAWTVQPPGVRFDPPARISIPNSGMPPGAVVDIFSFDHDVGEFVPVGTASVSEDGERLVSNPGFGVVKSGWHGCAPPPPPTGGACNPSACTICPPGGGGPQPKCDDCQNCNGGICEEKEVASVTVEANGKDGATTDVVVGVNQEVDFRAEAEANCDDREYAWDFGDGETSEESTPTHSYDEPGEYTVAVDVSCQGCQSNPSATDTITITVMELDLELDMLPEEDEPEPNEEEPGAFLVVNDDDDNDNVLEDRYDWETVEGEDDLVMLSMTLDDALDTGTVKLEATSGGDLIKIWQDQEKGVEVELPMEWDLDADDEVPETLWAEGLKSSSALQDVVLTLSYESDSGDPIEDKVLATVIDLEVLLAPQEEYEAPADNPTVSVLMGIFYRDFEDNLKVVADGSLVSWRVEEGPGTLSTGTSITESGIVVVELSTPTTPGAEITVSGAVERFKLEEAAPEDPEIETNLRHDTGPIRVVPGPPLHLSLVSSVSSAVADDTTEIELTATVTDVAGNPVEDDTAVSWEVDTSIVGFSNEPSFTVGGVVTRTFVAPALPENVTVIATSGGAFGSATIAIQSVQGQLTAPTETLDVTAAESTMLTVEATGGDGTPVFWSTSNGTITVSSALTAGQASTTLSTDQGSTGPVVVTATVGDKIFTWTGLFDASTAGVLIPEHRFLVADATDNGFDQVTWVDGSVHDVPVFAMTPVQVRGPANGSAAITAGGTAAIEAYVFESAPGGVVPGVIRANDMALAGATLDPAEANTGSASLRFDPTDSATISDGPDFTFGVAFGVSLWLRPAVTSASVPLMQSGAWSIATLTDGRVEATIETSSGMFSVTSDAAPIANVWNLVLVDAVAGELRLTLSSGTASVPFSGTLIDSTAAIELGGGFDGHIDDMRFFEPGTAPDLFCISGIDAAGFIQLDGNGEASITVRSRGLSVPQYQAVPAIVQIEVFPPSSSTTTLGSGELDAIKQTKMVGPMGTSVLYLLDRESNGLVSDVIRSFFGGDPQSTAGTVANIVGGVLIVGDIGAIVKNLWRMIAFTDKEPNYAEFVLSSLGLLTTFTPVLDVPIAAVRAIVVRIGTSDLAQVLVKRLRYMFTRGRLPDEAELAMLALLVDDDILLQGLNRVIKNEDLWEAALRICKKLGGGGGSLLIVKSPAGHKRVLDLIGASTADVGGDVVRSLRSMSDDVLTRLASEEVTRLESVIQSLQTLVQGANKLDTQSIARAVNNRNIITSNYDEILLLNQLSEVASAGNLQKLVNYLGGLTKPFQVHMVRGFRYELEGAIFLKGLLGGEIQYFDKLVGGTDIDFLLGSLAIQAKSGNALASSGAASALRWINVAAGEVGMENVRYLIPEAAAENIPDVIQKIFDAYDITVHTYNAIKRLVILKLAAARAAPLPDFPGDRLRSDGQVDATHGGAR